VFNIDDRGLIRRRGCTAGVIGPYAHGVRSGIRHREFGGLVFPTRRRVCPRRSDSRSLPFPTLVGVDIDRSAGWEA